MYSCVGTANQGFTLTLRGRVLQGSAPAYDAGSNTVIGGAALDTGARQYVLALGINSSGNTVAVLPTNTDAFGPGRSLRAYGPSYTLNDAGYHTYALVFNSQTQSASLFIDGVERISGYIGNGNFVADRGLYFAASSGGGMNFNLVRLTSPAAAPSGWFGKSLQTLPSYAFAVEQNAQTTESVQLFNPGTASRSATLEVVNPHDGLGVSIAEPTVTVAPGETKDIAVTLDAGTTPVGVYDDLLLKVAVDDGSTLYSNITVYVTPSGASNLPDLTLSANDIRSTTNGDGTVTLMADVHNKGTSPASNIEVQFYEFGNLLGTTMVPQVPTNGIGTTSITVPAMTAGDHLIRVVVDPSAAIPELDESNNEASKIIQPAGPPPAAQAGNILVTGSLPSTVYAGSLFSITGHAVYAITIDGATNTDYVVKGGAVDVSVKADDGKTWVYGGVHKSLQAPATPGTYRLSMTVTDQTFTGTRELVFKVIPAPPAGSPPPAPPSPPTTSGSGDWTCDTSGACTWNWTVLPTEPIPDSDLRVFSENIHFSKNNPTANEEITIFAEIGYWATSTALVAQNVPVNLYVTYPGSPKMKIGQTVIDSLSVGSPDFGSRYVYATWKNNQGQGIYIVEVEIDPSYAEANLLNNAATRAIIVGQLASGLGVVSGQVTNALNGVGGVTIHVLDANGAEIASTLTDQTGFYLVKDVPLGGVQVHIDPPSGYQPDAATKTVTISAASVGTVDFLLTKQPDTTPPVITPTVTGTLGNNGWYTGDVTVSWMVADDESPITAKNGCDTTTVSNDTAGTTFTCSATSSGGTASKSVTVQRDGTLPTITGSASPAPNANGWSNSSVTVSFVCSDATSGIATCAAPQTLGEGGNQSVSGTATDQAGNTASAQVTGINADVTAPQVAVTGVANGATYTLGSVPAAGCTTSDALSGVQTDATLSVTGGNADGTGTFKASCAGAMDKAGNPGAASVSYQVTGTTPGTGSEFSAFSVNPLRINQRPKTVFLVSNFTLGPESNGINPVQEAVTLTIGNFTTTIPAGSFRKGLAGVYAFAGKISNVSIDALIIPLRNNRFAFQAAAYGADFSGTQNPVTVELGIGDDHGATSVYAVIR